MTFPTHMEKNKRGGLKIQSWKQKINIERGYLQIHKKNYKKQFGDSKTWWRFRFFFPFFYVMLFLNCCFNHLMFWILHLPSPRSLSIFLVEASRFELLKDLDTRKIPASEPTLFTPVFIYLDHVDACFFRVIQQWKLVWF